MARKTRKNNEKPEVEEAEPIEAPTSEDPAEAAVEPAPDPEPTADTGPESDTPPPATPAPRKGMSVAPGLLLGGALAAALGFAAARYVVPQGWPFPGVTPEPDPLAVAQKAQAEQIAALETAMKDTRARLDALEGDGRLDELAAGLKDVKDRLATLSDTLNAIDARLLEVEKIPRGSGTEAAEAAARAYERELAAMRQMLDQELEAIRAADRQATATSQSAEEAAREATARAALAQVVRAIDSGQPFADPLATLAANGVDVPQALTDLAPEGVPTLSALQDSFPAAARAALTASIKALVEAGRIGRVEGFLRSQLGTRSLEPRAGDDPDAVLSRAEAALKQGDIAASLAEIEALPDPGRAAMADWVQQAETRLAALRALDTLTAQLNAK